MQVHEIRSYKESEALQREIKKKARKSCGSDVIHEFMCLIVFCVFDRVL